MRSAYSFNHELTTAHLQLRHNYMIYYTQTVRDNDYKRYSFNSSDGEEQTNKAYSGQVTKHAKKRIQHAIHKLLISSPERYIENPITKRNELFTINFITLTIPDTDKLVDAKSGYKLLLAPFIRVMRLKYGLTSYIWKAELQKRKQLHYHITTNTWIHHTAIREEWNYIIAKNGLMNSYKAKYPNRSPNSTDVHKIYKINDIASYLSKYISKEDKEGDKLNSKVWDCSLDLKHCKLPTVELNDDYGIELFNELLEGRLSEFPTEFCTIFKGNKTNKEIQLPPLLKRLRFDWREQHNLLLKNNNHV